MSGVAAGLARGLAMYGQGRMIAEDREAERQRQEAERQRQMAMMKLQQEQFALQREQFEAGQRQTALANKRVAETDTNEAIGKGFRPVGDQWDTFNDLVGIDPSKAETITVNGQTMRKVAPTQAFQQGIIAKREADNELQRKVAADAKARADILGTIKNGPMRALAAQLPLDELQRLTSGRLKDMMTPKAPAAPRDPKFIAGNDGNMYRYDERAGGLVPVPVIGQPNAAPSPDAMRTTNVPAMRPDAITQVPGAGFSSQYQPPRPAAQNAPTQYSNGQAQSSPFGSRGLFGKQKAAPPKYIEQIGALDAMDQLLDEYQNAMANVETALLQGSDPNLADAVAAHSQLMLVAKEAANLGVLNGGDLDILEKTITPPTGLAGAVRGKPAILKTIARAKRTNEIKRNTLNKVYGQFTEAAPTQAPSSGGAIPPSIWNED